MAADRERADQQEFSSTETMKQWGLEKGADFMLIGEINMIIDQERGDAVKYYQVDAYLVDLEDNDRWIKLGKSRAWGWQQGCMLQWRPGFATQVVYNTVGG